ncbi:MAG: 16S rRNA (cytosine(967)-C(5))-methyltransferase RsmB [Clostridia bacterium]|nr:16S rRNA (cytosine(967)-C(5))-methyltransferase RsmB [Clostridia bacterium]
MKTPRQTAFEILMRVEKDKAFSNKALDNALKKLEYSRQDSVFISALVYGVLERRITLDYQIARFLTRSIKRLKPDALTILRMGMYQLMYMDKIPPSACVNESVKLAKSNRCEYCSGLINAVLRKASDKEIVYPDRADLIEYLSVRYSVEKWLAKLFVDSYGEENAVAVLEDSFGRAPIYIRVNTLKTTKDELKELLIEQGVEVEETEAVENALMISNFDSIYKNELYLNGYFHVQDLASQLCCMALSPQKGETVIDMCSAPGGKSFTTAELMGNEGEIRSYDLYDHKIELIKRGAERLGITIIKASVHDSSVLDKNEIMADRVLCDAPCSGLGTIRRKPEIRYKSSEEIAGLPDIQLQILKNAAEYVKIKGILVYSTCTLNRAENECVVEEFLRQNTDFEIVPCIEHLDCYRDNDMVTLMPHKNSTDGFFVCKMIRKK